MYESNGANGDDMNELEKYMADPPLRLGGQFDILPWWKNQSDEFSVIANIARDLLVVQVSTIASELAFSDGGRTRVNMHERFSCCKKKRLEKVLNLLYKFII